MNDNICGFLELLVAQMFLGQFQEVVHLLRDVEHSHCAFNQFVSDASETLDHIFGVQSFVSDLPTLFQTFDVLKYSLWDVSRYWIKRSRIEVFSR